MKKPENILFLDIDGVLVRSFDAHGLNPAAYAQQIKQQPTNDSIIRFILDIINIDSESWIICFVTGRKRSLLASITEKQLHMFFRRTNTLHIRYYPEEMGYENLDEMNQWKWNEIYTLLLQNNAQNVLLFEDFPDTLMFYKRKIEEELSQHHIPDLLTFQSYLIVLNRYCLPFSSMIDLKDYNQQSALKYPNGKEGCDDCNRCKYYNLDFRFCNRHHISLDNLKNWKLVNKL